MLVLLNGFLDRADPPLIDLQRELLVLVFESAVVVAGPFVVPAVRTDVPVQVEDVLVERLVVQDDPRVLASAPGLVVVEHELAIHRAPITSGTTRRAVAHVLTVVGEDAHDGAA